MRYIAVILSIIFLGSCVFNDGLIKPDDSEPITVDSCMQLTEVILPEFITIYDEFFNGIGDSVYHYDDEEYSTLLELLIAKGYPEDSIQIFQEGNSIAAIIRGTNDEELLEQVIWQYDAIGQKSFFVVNKQAFIFGGALTFEEFKQIAIDLPSVAIFNFRNTNWTAEQYEEVARIILGDCKKGRRDANFMFNAAPISNELYCLFIQYEWIVVRGQIPNCTFPIQTINRA